MARKSQLQGFRRFLSGEHSKVFAAAARPHDPADYERPDLDGSGPVATDFPLGKTAPGASLDVWPARAMDGCTEPLAAGVPDLRGVWEVYEGRMKGHVEPPPTIRPRPLRRQGNLAHRATPWLPRSAAANNVAMSRARRLKLPARVEAPESGATTGSMPRRACPSCDGRMPGFMAPDP